MKYPQISIIIPSYNQGKYLEQAIQSIKLQDYSSTELIIIDGGSSDGSLDILEKYSSQLTYWESVPDQGQSHAINKGFQHATGEIITFLSSDDYYLPGTFLDVAEHFNQNPNAGAIIGGFAFLDDGKARSSEPIHPLIDGPTPVDLTLGPPGKYRLHQVATFYSRTALDVVGRFVREDYKYVMDRELLYRICREFPIILSQKTYGLFRRHPDSKSVGEILPFSREFSDLYLSALSGDYFKDRLRKKMAKYRLARGYVKYGKTVRHFPKSILTLIRAGLIYPSLFVTRSFWRKLTSA